MARRILGKRIEDRKINLITKRMEVKMTSKDIRKKAQDIFNESEFVFSRKVGFDEAFPEIDDITVEVTEDGHGVYKDINKRIYSKGSIGEFINCSNPLCYNGGFSIGSIIREMIRNNETLKEVSELCRGNEASPKGKRIYRKCVNFFHINVSNK
jgi:hypothetical protein